MKLTIIGATGNLGSSIAEEAIARGHEVVCVSRHPEDIRHTEFPDIPSLYGDCGNKDSLLKSVPRDTDVLVNAVMPDFNDPESYSGWVQNVIDCARTKQIKRLVSVGDSSVFEVAPGVRLNQTNFLTPFYRTWYGAHYNAHFVFLRETELDWIEIAPGAKIFPDQRLKTYRVAVDQLVTKDPHNTDYAAVSYIGLEDFGYACMDEIVNPHYHRVRICIAY